MRKIIFLTIAFTALFAACNPVEYDTFSTITGTVIDADDLSPINGVSVSLSPTGKSAYTGSDGYFQFQDLEVGQYTIQVQKSGYDGNRRTINAVGGETESVSITMKKQ